MTLPATLSLNQAAARDWGAVVVGAGPAGSLAARELARRGLAVLLVDRSDFPRPKVCGCCLNGRALSTLRAVGLGDLASGCGAVPLADLRLAGGGGQARLRLPGGVALSREALDAALVRAAVSAGADFLPRARAALETGGAGQRRRLLLHRPEGVARASAAIVLAADGLGGKLLARAGLTEAPARPGARLGAGVVVETADDFYRPATIFMACGRSGYVGLVRLEDGRLDLAAALDALAVRQAGGPGPLAARLLAEVGWPLPPRLADTPWRGTAALTRRAVRLAAHRVFALGDAAGYVEPFTGEGMAWALAAGAAVAPLAARAADRWRPELADRWTTRYRQLITQRQCVCRAAAAVLRRPLLTGALIHVLARLPALATPLVRYLHGATTPS
jgi:flavin-dependent dehydrogenase